MKILVTGTQGLAKSIADIYSDHTVKLVSRSTGHNIDQIDNWGNIFLSYDIVFNCAYHKFAQIHVLEYFYNAWKDDNTKIIVSIGSRAINGKRIETTINDDYWPYRLHKQTLQQAHDNMSMSAKCQMKIFNPGPIDTNMIKHHNIPKMSPDDLAAKIKQWTSDPCIKRVDVWQ